VRRLPDANSSLGGRFPRRAKFRWKCAPGGVLDPTGISIIRKGESSIWSPWETSTFDRFMYKGERNLCESPDTEKLCGGENDLPLEGPLGGNALQRGHVDWANQSLKWYGRIKMGLL